MKRQIPKTNKTVPKSLVGSPNLAKQVGVLHKFGLIFNHQIRSNFYQFDSVAQLTTEFWPRSLIDRCAIMDRSSY
jgi:hypothetical protein